MASSDAELLSQVRDMTGYTDRTTLEESELRSVVERAKSWITSRKSLDPDASWYAEDSPEREEALFWLSCLFSKVASGELDSPGHEVDNVRIEHLAANGDSQTTEWASRAQQALRNVSPAGSSGGNYGVTSIQRSSDRTYGEDGSTQL